MNIYLFSYGTLQKEKVQLETFGRTLTGTRDLLKGYRIDFIEIQDESVLLKSEQVYHPIAVPSGSPAEHIEGTVFELSETELQMADKYEVDDYKRIAVTLDSGKKAWVYVAT